MGRMPLAVFVGSLVLPSALAAQADIKTLCMQASNMGDALCVCLAEKAGYLSEDQRAFIAAMLAKDEAETTRLRGVMPVAEMMEASMFMPNAPSDCAKEIAGSDN